MNCNTVQRLLSAYVDSELSRFEMDRVSQHVHECDSCRFEEQDIRRLKSILTCTPLVEPPADFEARLCTRVFGEESPSEVRSLAETWPLLSGVTLVAAALTLLIINYVGEPRREESRSQRAMAWSMQRDDASLVGSDPFMSTSTSIPTSYVGK